MKRPLLVLSAAVLLVLATAPGVSAKTTKVPTWGEEHVVSGVGTVTPTVVGTTMSVRGEIHEAFITGSSPGTQESVSNWDLDLLTGGGTLWGTSRLLVTGTGGGFDCVFEGTIPVGSYFTAWTAHSVCHGFGTFAGVQSRSDAVSAPFGSTFTGYFFVPANKG